MYKKKLIIVFLFCFITLCCVAQTSKPVFLDTRLLLLAHPLFSVFDNGTGRFKGTSSEPILGEQEGIDKVLEKIKETGDYLLKSPKALREKLKTIPLTDRMAAERDFLAEKRMLEAKLEAMKMRVYMARLVPIQRGMTPYSSIYPQVNNIMGSIKNVIKTLKSKYKTDVVIDVADLLPWAAKPQMTASLMTNKHKEIYENKGKSLPENYLDWLGEADQYWASRLGVGSDVVPYGALDVRLEAIKLMEEEVRGYKVWVW